VHINVEYLWHLSKQQMQRREAEALKAALRENEALLHGVDAAHELADVATATAEVLPPVVSDAFCI